MGKALRDEVEELDVMEQVTKTGIQVEVKDFKGQWIPLRKSYVGSFEGREFYATLESAKKAVARMNHRIANGFFDHEDTPLEARYAEVTTVVTRKYL